MSDTPTPPSDSAPVPPADPSAPPIVPTPPNPDPDQAAGAGLKSDLAKERKARQALERELETIRASQMSDQERAVAEALAKGRGEAMSSVGRRLASAELRAALKGIVPDAEVAALIDDLDLSRYIGEDHEVDSAKVEAFAARLAAAVGTKPGQPAVPTGPRGGPATPDPSTMSMDEYRAWARTQRG